MSSKCTRIEFAPSPLLLPSPTLALTLTCPRPHSHSCAFRRLYGPFRQMWTLPFEMFLQVLKGFCEKSNYMTVPFTVVTKWAQRRAFSFLTRRDTSATMLLDVTSSSDFMFGDVLSRALPASALLTHVLTHTSDHTFVTHARHLSFICRDHVEIRIDDWLLVACGSKKLVVRVHEMAELTMHDRSCLRLWGTESRSLAGMVEASDGMLRLSKSMRTSSLLIRLEMVSVMQLLCEDRGTHLEYRYVF